MTSFLFSTSVLVLTVPFAGALVLYSNAALSGDLCTFHVAIQYIEHGRTVVEEFISRHIATGHLLSDGFQELRPEEMSNIRPSDLQFTSADAEGSPDQLGFTLTYLYEGSSTWHFIVSYDRKCAFRIGYFGHR
jgi:hypothetical protein